MADTPAPRGTGTPGAAPRAARRWPWLLGAVLALPLAAAAIVASAWQALHTKAGTRWWLEQIDTHVPGLVLEAPRGALLGPASEFSLERLSIGVGRSTVRIDGLQSSGLELVDWRFAAPFVHLQARTLAARGLAVELSPAPAPVPAAGAPTDLQLPLSARIDTLRIDRLQLPGLAAPIEALSARVEAGSTHRIDALSLRWNGLQAEGGGQIEAAAPLPLRARFALHGAADATEAQVPPWARDVTLALQASGPLSRFDTQATVVMQAQRLDAKAQVTPFEPLPVSQLDAQFVQLDLARLLAPFLSAGTPAPTTELNGSAVLQLNDDQPLVLRAQVRNEAPGRWDQRRAPVREIDLLLRGRGTAWGIERARVQLASDARTPAGQVEASGRVEGPDAQAQIRLDGVLLQGLDQRAPSLRLSGPVDLKHAAASDATRAFGRLAFDAKLEGALLGPARRNAPAPLRGTAQLALRGSATPTLAVIDTLSARAGAARLDGKGRAQRSGERWDTEADLKLADFDPAAWLPGEPTAAWRRSRNALNGQLSLRAQVPAAAADAGALLAALRGTLRADLSDSAFAGQPLALQLQADADGQGRLDATATARAADNRADLNLKLRSPARGGAPAADAEQLLLQLDAPALAQLAPLADALGLGPLAGRARLETRADGAIGAWLLGGAARGALVTRGSVDLERLQFSSLQLEAAQGRWDATLPGSEAVGSALARAALQGEFTATQIRTPALTLPTVALQADGTLGEHRASLRATLRQPQAPGSEASAAEPAPLSLVARLTGAWRAGDNGAPNIWRARLPELSLLPQPPRSGTTAAPAAATAAETADAAQAGAQVAPLPLVVARDLAFELQQGEQLLRWQMEPGSVDVLGAVLRWQTLRWQRQGERPPQLDLLADVEPFEVARLLRRLQPDFGWVGDLRVGAQVRVRSDPAVSAHIEIARTGGDLQVNEFGSIQPLGLTDARLELTAESGLWQFNQLVAGAQLGRVVGAQTVRTAPDLLWPAPDAPVEGALRVQVENLGAWGAWVPAGWRLGGQMDGTLLVGGRFGGPDLTGQLAGRQLALRNTLEGVALSDGELDARFDGDTARLTTLRFKAGEGELRASGDARLGDAPQARLQLTAERATVLGRVDRRVVASGQASLALDAQTIKIDGDFRADEGLIDISRGDAPTLGEDVTVRRAGDAPAAAETAAPRAPRTVDLRLAVNLGPRFKLRGRGLDTRLEGDLRLTTPSGRLAAHGEIRTDAGTYEAYGQKLAIERGVITFVGDIANPRLDIQAVRANTDTRVGVIVGGNVQSPRVRLFSDPELPGTEKLALLVTGRSYDSLAGGDVLLLQRAAFALLAGDGADGKNPLDVAGLLRLDELSVRQSDGAVKETVVTVGKQISDRVYVGYERGLNATAGNWQLIYRIAQRFTLRAQSGEDPAVDLIWIFRWN
ncbi:translocation/assembly module TamB domain-containing protein [Methylibium petroleiphilum]|uniref:translocation/assembly module TamB domain-containing protein n=1 Tax=Methylibium petroleiphilum TaxID=105560 RepID=UPI003D2BDD45